MIILEINKEIKRICGTIREDSDLFDIERQEIQYLIDLYEIKESQARFIIMLAIYRFINTQ